MTLPRSTIARAAKVTRWIGRLFSGLYAAVFGNGIRHAFATGPVAGATFIVLATAIIAGIWWTGEMVARWLERAAAG